MKQGKTLTELAMEVQRQAEARRDFVAPTTELEMVAAINTDGDGVVSRTPVVRVNGHGEFGVRDLAHGQIAQHTGIRKEYYDRMRTEAPQLLATNVNHWWKNGSDRRLVRTLDGHARGYVSDTYRPLDNIRLMEAVLPTLGEFAGLQFMSQELTETRLYLKVVVNELTVQVRKGDDVRFGVLIQNSEVGLGSLDVVTFADRLICTNGMIATKYGTKKRHAGKRLAGGIDEAVEFFSDETRQQEDKTFFLKVRDLIRGVLTMETAQRIAAEMRDTTERKLEGDVEKGVLVLANQFSLNQNESSSVLRHLIEGGDLSQWGVLNAVTRTAQDVESYDRATELEAIGGQILTLEPSQWKEISKAA